MAKYLDEGILCRCMTLSRNGQGPPYSRRLLEARGEEARNLTSKVSTPGLERKLALNLHLPTRNLVHMFQEFGPRRELCLQPYRTLARE